MKYIKLFEKITSNFWLIPTDDRYEFAIKKITKDSDDLLNLTQNVYNSEEFNKEYHNQSFMYVGYNKYRESWEWMPFIDSDGLDGALEFHNDIDAGYVFAGNIDIEDWELDALKYNL